MLMFGEIYFLKLRFEKKCLKKGKTGVNSLLAKVLLEWGSLFTMFISFDLFSTSFG